MDGPRHAGDGVRGLSAGLREPHRSKGRPHWRYRLNKTLLASSVMLVAAAFEVGGDAFIRAGLRGRGALLVAVGFAVLGSYGIIVNLLPMDFSRLLGAYVGFFAIVSILCGRLIFK
jgi:drug/metabolite transporter superfamily protein YnfA